MKLTPVMSKYLAPFSRSSQILSPYKNQLMMYGKMLVIYFENYMKMTIVPYGHRSGTLTLKQNLTIRLCSVLYIYRVFQDESAILNEKKFSE
jgi:hypothetical protein